MPHRAPLRAARQLLLDIQDANRASIAGRGDIADPSVVADLIEGAIADEVLRRGVLMALGEFIATTLDGGVIDVTLWTPLLRVQEKQKKTCGS